MKVGDKVRCITLSPVGAFGEVGKEYTVYDLDTDPDLFMLSESPTRSLLKKDRFMLVKSSSSFKVRDRVKVKDSYSGYGAGFSGTILRPGISSDSWSIELDGTTTLFTRISAYYERNLELLPTAPKNLTAGDKVEVDCKYWGKCSGTIMNIVGNSPMTYEVLVDTVQGVPGYSVIMKYLESELTLVLPPKPSLLYQSQRAHGYSLGGSFTGGITGTINSISGITSGVKKYQPDAPATPGCQHVWSTYVGLNKKMEICNKCPASKNERGIYE